MRFKLYEPDRYDDIIPNFLENPTPLELLIIQTTAQELVKEMNTYDKLKKNITLKIGKKLYYYILVCLYQNPKYIYKDFETIMENNDIGEIDYEFV